MICPGLVTNVTNFGAFVDIGVHQDGLVHISELAHKFVEDPRKVVNPGDQVIVKVLKVDLNKNQIALSMKLEDKSEHTAFRDVKGDRPGQDRPRGGFDPNRKPQQRHDGPRPPRDGGRPQASGGGQHSGGSRGGPAPKPASPFNNPFAALLNNQNKK